MTSKKRYSNDCILAFGDTHFPYAAKGWYEFLKEIKETYEPDRVVHMGDLCDMYSVSSYPTDIDHPDSFSQELKNARKDIKKLGKLFPKMEVVSSNHDDRAYRKSRVAGISRQFLIPFGEVVGAPEGWKWHEDLTLTVDSTREQFFFAHHKSGSAIACAKDKNVSSVIGHFHTRQGVQVCRPHKKTLFGVDAGCLISDKGSPFKYASGNRLRPARGCILIYQGTPQIIPFD